MRTVIFFGLMSIADSITYYTKPTPTPSEQEVIFGVVIFCIAALMDIVEFIKGFGG